MFPRDNAWNQRVDRLPVAPGSARIVASIGLEQGLHPDFGSGRYEGPSIGIPFDVVSAARAAPASASGTPGSPTAGATRSRAASTSRVARAPTATGWTSADAAGLPILPGLARYDEVRRGRIDHAVRRLGGIRGADFEVVETGYLSGLVIRR